LTSRDAIHAAAATLALFSLYAATACRTFHDGDSAEIAAAVATFGVPHPPGYPLYTLITGLAVHALPLSPAFAANLVTGAWGALAMGGLWLLARRLGASPLGCWVAALSAGLGATWWAQCVAAEVYTLDGLLLVLGLHAALGIGPERGRGLLLGVVAGLWLGHRPINIAYFPAVLAVGATRALVTRSRWAHVVLGGALSGLVYFYLPIASARQPAIDIGDPEDWQRFWTVVRGAPYGRHWLAGGLEGAAERVATYLGALPRELGPAWLLAPAGFFAVARRSGRRDAAALAGVAVIAILLGAAYGILDVEVVFLPASLGLALLAAPGCDVAIARFPRGGRWAVAVAALALLPTNYARTDLRTSRLSRQLAEDTLASTPVNGFLVVAGDTAIHGLWYLQAVEQARPDVIVFSPGHVTPWYVRQLQQRYPSEHWPEWEERFDPASYTRSVIRALVGWRPVVATQAVDLSTYLGGTEGSTLAVVPHGILHAILDRQQRFDLNAAAQQNEQLVSVALGRLPALGADPRSEDASTVLGYALGAVSSGDWLARVGRRDAARRLHQGVLALRPDELEEPLRRDARRELGAAPPELALEARARAAIARLDLPLPGAGAASPGAP
jgi:hypothetical protein